MNNLILHIGTGKTGSTALQDFLNKNRESLYKEGYSYPKVGLRNNAHFVISAAFDCGPNQLKINKNQLLDFLSTISKENMDVILSSEYFSNSKNPKLILDILLDYFANIKIVCYFRRHDYWYESLYNQAVKKRRNIQWGEGFKDFIQYRTRDKATPFNYKEIAELWDIEDERVQFFPKAYEKNQMVECDIRNDFISEIGIDPSNLEFLNNEDSNISIQTQYIQLVEKINNSTLPDSIAHDLVNQVSRLPKTNKQKLYLQSYEERQKLINENIKDYKWLSNKYNCSNSIFFNDVYVRDSDSVVSEDDTMLQLFDLVMSRKLDTKNFDLYSYMLKELIENDKIAMIPVGFRGYTKQFMSKKLGLSQESLPFDNGFFPPQSIASIFNNPTVDLDLKNPSSHAVCIKHEKFKHPDYGLGIKFISSSYEEVNRAIENSEDINKYLDSTYAYYTLDLEHNFVLAHYNWHKKASIEKSKGIYDPSINLSNISKMMNRRIKRMMEICELSYYKIFIYFENQNYNYMMIDDHVFSLNDLESLKEVVSRKFGSSGIVIDANNIDNPSKLLEKIYEI